MGNDIGIAFGINFLCIFFWLKCAFRIAITVLINIPYAFVDVISSFIDVICDDDGAFDRILSYPFDDLRFSIFAGTFTYLYENWFRNYLFNNVGKKNTSS